MYPIIIAIISLFLIYILNKFINIPMPYLIIPLLSTIIFNLFVKEVEFVFNIKRVAQIITGTYIGSTINRRDLNNLDKTIIPILLSLFSMAFAMIISGFILVKFFNFDLATALLSSVAGGVSDITLMSYEFNANIGIVALFQTSRMLSIIVIFPKIIEVLNKNSKKTENITNKSSQTFEINYFNFLLTLIVGTVFGMLGVYINMPAGALTFSTIGTLIFSISTNKAIMPIFTRRIAQVISGILVGSSINYTIINNLEIYLFPVLIVLFILIANNIIISYIISKFTTMDRSTAMFGCAPGGAGDMVLIASEMKLDVNHPQIILMHVLRLITILTIFPFIINILIKLFS